MRDFHTLPLETVRPLTQDSTLLGFAVPDSLQQDFCFTPGQYLTLEAEINQETVRRPYSICSAVHKKNVQVAIKHQPHGKFSDFARQLKTGDTLRVMPPEGRFTLQIGGTHQYLFIASGSGITPILSMIESVLFAEPNSRVVLLYGSRTSQDIMFLEEIENLKNRYLERFCLFHFLSQEQSDFDILNGRIDSNKLIKLNDAGIISLKKFDAICLCAPIALVETLSAWLADYGVDQKRIRKEIFALKTPSRRTQNPTVTHSTLNKTITQVHVTLDGRSRNFDLWHGETVIEAACRLGIELPYSCASGTCGTCRCRVKSGDAEVQRNYALEQHEIERGFSLACQLRPSSKLMELDFDER